MPLPLSTDVRDALYTREISSAWAIEMFCADGTIRAWDRRITKTLDGQSFEGIGDQFNMPEELQTSTDLIPEPIIITFDSAAVLDSDTVIGRLVDRNWYQRRFRTRQYLLVPGTNSVSVIGSAYDWFGYMDNIVETLGDGGKPVIALTCESGIFRTRGRNMRTYSDVDQRQIDALDACFVNTATKPFQSIPFGESWSNIAGYKAPPGSSSGSTAPSLYRRY